MPTQASVPHEGPYPEIAAAKFLPENDVVRNFLRQPPYHRKRGLQIQTDARRLVEAARASGLAQPRLDTFLSEYGLANSEGVALMCLAESLLRIPDAATADQLIADKLHLGDWAAHAGQADSRLVNASTWALMLTGKLVEPDAEFSRDPATWLAALASRISEPVVQAAMRSAMHILGNEFVLGTNIQQALQNSQADQLYSFDMLGEGARTEAAADDYFAAYADAIKAIGQQPQHPGHSISIKLSALHPRYQARQRKRVLNELVPRLVALCDMAATGNLQVTIDAEEADRLELSLQVFAATLRNTRLDNFGLAVQAYGKRALPVLRWLVDLSRSCRQLIPVRLVKGAYWDSEIKHAQVSGYPGYPVFTRKAATDLSFLTCAHLLLQHPDALQGQFATHNAHTLAAVLAMARANRKSGRTQPFEMQRLHGMGEILYATAANLFDMPPVRIYAPVGTHENLLAYLVRRLLENGANSSFVNRFLNAAVPAGKIVQDPLILCQQPQPAAGLRFPLPGIPLPENMYRGRKNSRGMDLSDASRIARLQMDINKYRNHSALTGALPPPTTARQLDVMVEQAATAQPSWDQLGVASRAAYLYQLANLLEQDCTLLITLLCLEAGKTIQDGLDEVREAVDFCRYYAQQAEQLFQQPQALPGPTGEANCLSLHGRGVWVAISPWNFPLAIFTGQVAAALVTGNTVVAKAAEQTPRTARHVLQLLTRCGLPKHVCQLADGGAETGERLVRHAGVAGVVFTGSTHTARLINICMAQSVRPIAPLIAETGGQNAMLVDSSALLEQVVDDVVHSAFNSAGQRCSALRVLYLQDDIAEQAISLIRGAMAQLRLGDPTDIETDIGPVINHAAAARLQQHIETMQDKVLYQVPLPAACAAQSYVAPTLIGINAISDLHEEHFGPILHIIRFAADSFEATITAINNTGFALTLGLHTRIESRINTVFRLARAGNLYVNRTITGAVVGTQPFGGQGYSGTGPKAGGPNYLIRFTTERVITTNTAAFGGNAELLSTNF